MTILLATLALVGAVSGLTAFIDMGMNGARYAQWAPWGLGIGLVCFGTLELMGV